MRADTTPTTEARAISERIERELFALLELRCNFVDAAGTPRFASDLALHALVQLTGRIMRELIRLDPAARVRCLQLIAALDDGVAPASRRPD